jgi:hypothetical protein
MAEPAPPVGGCAPSALAVHGVPVGALIVPPRHIQPVRRALNEAGLGGNKPVTRYAPAGAGRRVAAGGPPPMALHVSSEAAVALEGGGALPPLLAELLARGEVRWVGGLRVGSPACLGGGQLPSPNAVSWALQKVERTHRAALAEAAEVSQPSWARGGAEAAFRFVEVFGGIGGFRLALDALGGRCVFCSELDQGARIGLYPIVTLQYSSTTLYQVSYHIQ